jgi:hypothetical protein
MKVTLPYGGDNKVKADSRRHQSEFREKILHVDFDSSNPRARCGNLLLQDAAILGLILPEGNKDYIGKTCSLDHFTPE